MCVCSDTGMTWSGGARASKDTAVWADLILGVSSLSKRRKAPEESTRVTRKVGHSSRRKWRLC